MTGESPTPSSGRLTPGGRVTAPETFFGNGAAAVARTSARSANESARVAQREVCGTDVGRSVLMESPRYSNGFEALHPSTCHEPLLQSAGPKHLRIGSPVRHGTPRIYGRPIARKGAQK
jgi:hypothetical protein